MSSQQFSVLYDHTVAGGSFRTSSGRPMSLTTSYSFNPRSLVGSTFSLPEGVVADGTALPSGAVEFGRNEREERDRDGRARGAGTEAIFDPGFPLADRAFAGVSDCNPKMSRFTFPIPGISALPHAAIVISDAMPTTRAVAVGPRPNKLRITICRLCRPARRLSHVLLFRRANIEALPHEWDNPNLRVAPLLFSPSKRANQSLTGSVTSNLCLS